jgi:hypothetical protein
MDAAAVPWVVLGVLLVAVVLLAAVGARPHRRPRAVPVARQAAPPRPAFPDDDLPAFRAAPPGTPGAAPPEPRPERPRMPPTDGADGELPAGRAVLVLAVAALVLVAVLAVLAAVPHDRADGDRPAASASAGAPSSTPPPAPVPALPAVPAEPLPGEPGAGALAALSVPLDDDGWAARLAFAPLVLEHRAVGVSVTSAAVSVTRRTDGTALAHVRLPTWNCLAAEAPADPAAAGCSPAGVEYADLPSPALATSVADGTLRLTGRFPTYTRPAGGEPVYTGRVYELTVTLTTAQGGAGAAWEPARGTVFLGLARAESLDGRGLSAVRRGG